VEFAAYHSHSGSLVWSYSADTGGTNFQVAGFYSCNSESWYDYTDYEEVYDTAGPVPSSDFFFTNNWADSFGGVGTWGIWTTGTPSGVNVYIDGGSSSNPCGSSVPGYCPITIANEPYYMYFTNGLGSTNVELTASPESHFWNVTVADLSSDSPIYLSTFSVPSGWSVNFLTSQGSPTFTSELSFSLPSSTSTGAYNVGLSASDGSGSGSYDRIVLGVNVLPVLSTALSGSPHSGGIDLGQTTNLSATVSGGSGVYNYDWTSLPTGCDSAASASLHCVPTSSGSFSVSVNVTDSLGYRANATITYVVDNDPNVSTPTASITPIDERENVTFRTTASGGSGGLTFSWTGLPVGCSSSDTATLTCMPTGNGIFDVGAQVTDSNNFLVSSSPLSYTVYTDPVATPPATPPSASAIDVGTSTSFSVSASGGYGSYTYTWTGLPVGCSSSDTPLISCSPSLAGNYTISVTVVDSTGYQARGPIALITVHPDPVIVGGGAASSNILLGQGLVINGSAGLGAPPYTYQWTGLPQGCSSSDSASLSC